MRVLSYQSQAKFETTFKWKPAKIRRERASVCDRFAWKILQRKKHFECTTTSGYTTEYLAYHTNELWYRNFPTYNVHATYRNTLKVLT